MSDGERSGPAISGDIAGEAERRERSRIQFPYEDLAASESIVKVVHDSYGGRATRDQVAAALNSTVTSGSFRLKVLAAQMFGLVTTSRDGIQTTEDGVAVLDDATAPSARANAFLKVPLYRALYEQYRGGTIPSDAGLEAAIRELGVPAKQVSTARQAFLRSADRAGYFHQGRSRLVPPPAVKVEAAVRREEEQLPPPEEEPGMQAHPLLASLFKELPSREEGYSKSERENFKAALDAIFTIVYGSARDGETGAQGGTNSHRQNASVSE